MGTGFIFGRVIYTSYTDNRVESRLIIINIVIARQCVQKYELTVIGNFIDYS